MRGLKKATTGYSTDGRELFAKAVVASIPYPRNRINIRDPGLYSFLLDSDVLQQLNAVFISFLVPQVCIIKLESQNTPRASRKTSADEVDQSCPRAELASRLHTMLNLFEMHYIHSASTAENCHCP